MHALRQPVHVASVHTCHTDAAITCEVDVMTGHELVNHLRGHTCTHGTRCSHLDLVHLPTIASCPGAQQLALPFSQVSMFSGHWLLYSRRQGHLTRVTPHLPPPPTAVTEQWKIACKICCPEVHLSISLLRRSCDIDPSTESDGTL